MTSLLFYLGFVLMLAGLFLVAVPLLGKRVRGAILAAGGFALVAVCLAWPPPRESQSKGSRLLDQAMARYHFREIHRTRICAPAEKVYDAIHKVSADDIALFNLLTTLRGFGSNSDEDSSQPILDVATSRGFILLADAAPTELLLGTAGPFWRITSLPQEDAMRLVGQLRSVKGHAEAFAALDFGGYPKAAFNFVVEPGARGCQTVTTETRIGGGSPEMTATFAKYWRAIWPGSALLRRTWLDAIRQRAEADNEKPRTGASPQG